MGTSSSNPGPGSSTPLVPPWADAPPPTPEATPDSQPSAPPMPPLPPPPPRRFQQFRTQLGRFAAAGKTSALKSALGHYARTSMGGAGTAARRLSRASATGSSLLAFLHDISQGGTGKEWLGFEVSELVGKGADEVIDRIASQLCPTDGLQDDAAIRLGLNEALSEILSHQKHADLSALTLDEIVTVIETYLTAEVCMRIELDSKDAFLKASDPRVVIQREEALRSFVRSIVDAKASQRLYDALKVGKSKAFPTLIKTVIEDVFTEFLTYE